MFARVVVCSVLCGVGGAAAALGSSQEVTIKISFHALWWSQQQMDGLDPNKPPPKTTDVTLTRWEYSDPVGVPHPLNGTMLMSFMRFATG